jgi:zinc transporter ZupT
MNLIGSLIHNFIDGLALGVAFATGKKEALIPVLIAIIAH